MSKSSSESLPRDVKETEEVITLEDGSKVVRKRRKVRKARSGHDILRQKEEESGKPVFILASMGVLLVIILILCGLCFLKLAYYNSPTHITKLQDGVSHTFKSNVKLNEYKLGLQATEIKFLELLSGENTSPYFKAKLSKVSLPHELNTLLIGDLKGSNDATIGTLDLDVDLTKQSEAQYMSDESAAYLPYAVRELVVSKFNLNITDEERWENPLKLIGSQARLLFDDVDGFTIFIKGGKLENFKGIPHYVESASIVVGRDDVVIKKLVLTEDGVGSFKINGAISLKEERLEEFNCKIEHFNLESLSKPIADLLEAKVSSKVATLKLNSIGGLFELDSDLSLSLRGMSLKSFKFLSVISEKFKHTRYASVNLLEAKELKMSIDNEGYHFTEMDYENEGSLALEGNFSIGHEGSLSGALKVGIPTSVVISDYPDIDVESLERNRGFVWYEISLAGTTKVPEDNFLELFNETIDFLR